MAHGESTWWDRELIFHMQIQTYIHCSLWSWCHCNLPCAYTVSDPCLLESAWKISHRKSVKPPGDARKQQFKKEERIHLKKKRIYALSKRWSQLNGVAELFKHQPWHWINYFRTEYLKSGPFCCLGCRVTRAQSFIWKCFLVDIRGWKCLYMFITLTEKSVSTHMVD